MAFLALANDVLGFVTRKAIAISTINDNTIVAAPGVNKRLRITYLHLQSNSATDNTATVKFGASDTNGDPFPMPAKGLGCIIETSDIRGWALPENTALIVSLSVGVAVVGQVHYWVEQS